MTTACHVVSLDTRQLANGLTPNGSISIKRAQADYEDQRQLAGQNGLIAHLYFKPTFVV